MRKSVRLFGEILVTMGTMALLGSCLSAGASFSGAPDIVGSIASELAAVFRDPATQWMVFACVGVYFVCFLLLRQRWMNEGLRRVANPLFWLTLVIVPVVGHFVFSYEFSARSTQSIAFLGTATLGSGAFVWRDWNPEKSGAVMAKVIWIFVILLVLGTLISAGPFLEFQYRGRQRWAGLWDNPNTFGMLMGCGGALAAGVGVQSLKFMVQSSEKESEAGIWKSRTVRWVKVVFFVAAVGVLSFGLIKSYSRGAWLGAVIGISFLGYQFFRFSDFQIFKFSKVTRTWGSLVLIIISTCILAFWNSRYTEHLTARRAFSVANVNDFSWRRRLSAYEGSWQMIADKPWIGFGWNQPELVYDKFYRKPKVDEGMAIQMNDYFTLGTTLGIPALGCFLAYIWLSLTQNGERGMRKEGEEHRTSNIEHPTSNWGAHAPRVSCSAPSRDTSLSLSQSDEKPVREAQTGTAGAAVVPMHCWNEEEWLRMTCRAGAIVLLGGFFFDGGLFKLATGATFWILIELGSAQGVQSSRFKVQSSGNAEIQSAP